MYLDRSWRWINDHSNVEQGNITIGTNSCRFLTPTQLKLMVELGEDSGTKNWCKMLARVNNVERDSQIRKWNKWTNSNMWHTKTHTRIDKWGRATKEWAQNVESTENACVAQLKRDASTIALLAYTTLVHNL